jgi:hypothetical protein
VPCSSLCGNKKICNANSLLSVYLVIIIFDATPVP